MRTTISSLFVHPQKLWLSCKLCQCKMIVSVNYCRLLIHHQHQIHCNNLHIISTCKWNAITKNWLLIKNLFLQTFSLTTIVHQHKIPQTYLHWNQKKDQLKAKVENPYFMLKVAIRIGSKKPCPFGWF
jgi:hypothetical protein